MKGATIVEWIIVICILSYLVQFIETGVPCPGYADYYKTWGECPGKRE
jgi:hypothetical protein